jgi:hypothetical protein
MEEVECTSCLNSVSDTIKSHVRYISDASNDSSTVPNQTSLEILFHCIFVDRIGIEHSLNRLSENRGNKLVPRNICSG